MSGVFPVSHPQLTERSCRRGQECLWDAVGLRAAVTRPVTGKGSHFSSTIYLAVFIMLEGDTVFHSADSARFLNRFSSSTWHFPFFLSFLPEHFWLLWTMRVSPSPSNPCQLFLSSGSLFAVSGELASLKRKVFLERNFRKCRIPVELLFVE